MELFHNGFMLPAPEKRPALTHPWLDPWLLGGIAVFAWTFLFLNRAVYTARELPALRERFSSLGLTMLLLVNFPHFTATYQLAYGQGWDFVRKQAWPLLGFPIIALIYFSLAYLLIDQRLFLLGLSLNLMFILLTLNFTFQCFGCMMIYSKLDGYALAPGHARLLKWSLLSIAITNILYRHTLSFSSVDPLNFQDPSWEIHPGFYFAALAASAILFLAMTIQVFWKKYQEKKQLPSPAFLAPYLMMAVSWLPFFQQVVFIGFLLPFFHSLQHLTVVYKVESLSLSRSDSGAARAALTATGLIGSGYLLFHLLPGLPARHPAIFSDLDARYLSVAITAFLSCHHYFVDRTLWSSKGKLIQDLLR